MSFAFLPFTTVTLALAGFGVGLAYFASLRRGVAELVQSTDLRVVLAMFVFRLVLVLLLLVTAVRLGAMPLLAAFTGFLLARTFALRRSRGR